MAYRQKSMRRRRPRGKRTSLAKKAYILAKKAYRMPELKHYDTHVANGNTTWSGSIVSLVTPAQGITDVTRIGDKITLKSLQLKGHFNSAASTCWVRLIVVRSINLGVTTVSDVLKTLYLGTANAPDAP